MIPFIQLQSQLKKALAEVKPGQGIQIQKKFLKKHLVTWKRFTGENREIFEKEMRSELNYAWKWSRAKQEITVRVTDN